MEPNNNQFGNSQMPMQPKPDNNLVLAIFTTICCCLPFGIVGIVYASKVNSLYAIGQYAAASQAASNAKKWSIIGICIGLAVQVIYMAFYGFAAMKGMY